MLMADFLDRIYIPHRLRGKSERSVRLYRLCIQRFSETLQKQPELSDLTNENILLHLKLRSEVSAATRNKELAELTAMWRFAVQKQLHNGWPEVTAETEPKRTPQAWLQADMTKLLSAAGRCEGTIAETPAWLFWTTLIRVCLDTGERIGALRQCEWSWVEGDSMVIPAEARKGKTSDKWYRLSSETTEFLEQMKQHRTTRVIFEWPYAETYLWTRYRKLLESAKLPTGRKHGLHRIRKTSASVAYAAGLDPQDLLDHSDRRTTQRYLDPRFTRETQPSQILADWLRNPPPDEKRKQA
jgi:integrase